MKDMGKKMMPNSQLMMMMKEKSVGEATTSNRGRDSAAMSPTKLSITNREKQKSTVLT